MPNRRAYLLFRDVAEAKNESMAANFAHPAGGERPQPQLFFGSPGGDLGISEALRKGDGEVHAGLGTVNCEEAAEFGAKTLDEGAAPCFVEGTHAADVAGELSREHELGQ